MKKRKSELEISLRETEHQRLLTLGNKLGVVEGRWADGGGDWVMHTERVTSCDEHWILICILAYEHQ